MTPLTSLLALEDAIRALPPVSPGKIRVFRGQADEYPTITPAAYRNHLERHAIWTVYCRLLLADIMHTAGNIRIDEAEIQVWSHWLDAIAQHYSSGSRYLDVTHSIESAAWFALHRGDWKIEHSLLGPPGPSSRRYDLPAEERWLKYTRSDTPGYLYAFDVDSWDETAAIAPELAVIDLSRAPEPFRTPRMIAQQGCLIRTGGARQFDLLRERVEGTPLRIAWPMTGSAFVLREVEEMFPPPTVDAWYRRFLSVPMVPDVDEASGGVMLKRPLPVTLYHGATDSYNATLTDTEAFLAPPLIHEVINQTGVEADPGEEWWRAVSIRDATPIVLEAPLLRVFGSADSDSWNHELLFGDISDSVATSGPSQARGEASLLNVLFQFSHFEEMFWERAGRTDETTTLTRGLWIARHGDEIVVVLFEQNFPGTIVRPWLPALVRLDRASRRLIVKPADSSLEWTELASSPALGKPVIVALHMLRALSPKWKVAATPSRWLERGSKTAEATYLVGVAANDAQLMRVSPAGARRDWFFMRDDEGDPYTPKVPKRSLMIRDTKAFRDVAASVFHDALLAADLPAQQS